jgi:hypothetical protein
VGKLPQYCCGCGVKLQQTDPDAPGYFIIPKRLLEDMEQKVSLLAMQHSLVLSPHSCLCMQPMMLQPALWTACICHPLECAC